MRPHLLTSFGNLYSAFKNKGRADDANKLKARLIEILRKLKWLLYSLEFASNWKLKSYPVITGSCDAIVYSLGYSSLDDGLGSEEDKARPLSLRSVAIFSVQEHMENQPSLSII